MPEVPEIPELAPEKLSPRFATDALGFGLTDELPALDAIVGQPRAVRALELGLGIKQPGYHVYLAGPAGTGKMELARRTLLAQARTEPAPVDWLYVNNFDEPEQPLAICLPAGQGRALKQDMQNLVGRLLEELPKAFQREDFSREKERLRQQYKKQGDELLAELDRQARERSFAIQQLGDGQIMFLPLKEGKPLTPEEAQQLSPEEVQQLERRQRELIEAADMLSARHQEVERQLNADVRQVERTFAAGLIEPLLAEISSRYGVPKLSRWLERLKIHFVRNLDRFRRRADRLQASPLEALVGEPLQADLQERFFEYQVNLLVDNAELTHAPVMTEPAPTYRNLMGAIDRMVDRFGRVVSNFTRVKPGSLLRAGGGYLILEVEELLREPFVWKELKRTLKSGQAEIEAFDPFALFTVSALKPEPIPVNVKIVVLGHPLLYHLLSLYDDEFRELFRIKADFDTQLDLGPQAGRVVGMLVRRMSQEEGLAPFDAGAILELLRAGARLAGDQRRQTAEFRRLQDIAREAAFWARKAGAAVVTAGHVSQALQEQVYRSDLVASRIRQLIADGTLLISLDAPAIGQVNALSVADLGDYAFGWPCRLTASVGVGTAGVINIERESRLSGRTFDKGLLILEGYLRNQYAREQALALSASVAMEQSYGGVDGDSASVAELLCLTSAIAQIPLRQDVAVTGSVNQWGQVQAIGAVNEKIEGFFEVCRNQGLSGRQGVCIPKANVVNLVLRQDVVEAVAQGKFHVWPVSRVDEAMALLTGLEPGSPDRPETFHGMVASRLARLAQAMKAAPGAAPAGTVTRIEQPAAGPEDPRPPFPGNREAFC